MLGHRACDGVKACDWWLKGFSAPTTRFGTLTIVFVPLPKKNPANKYENHSNCAKFYGDNRWLQLGMESSLRGSEEHCIPNA